MLCKLKENVGLCLNVTLLKKKKRMNKLPLEFNIMLTCIYEITANGYIEKKWWMSRLIKIITVLMLTDNAVLSNRYYHFKLNLNTLLLLVYK